MKTNRFINIKAALFIAVSALMSACTIEDAVQGVEPRSEQLNVAEILQMTASETTKTFEIKSDAGWDITIDKPEWTELTASSMSGNGTAQIELRTDANTTRKERTATITIRTKGGVSQTIEVKQSLSDVILDIAGGDNQVLEYEASATDSKNFAFTCNTTWEITTTESWIHCDKKEGGQAITTTQSATVGVTVDEIQTDVDREGIIVVSAENGAKTKQITVKQTGKLIELSVSPKEFSVEATGAQKTIQIACNADWTIEFDKGDIVCETTTGTGNRDVVIDCQPNNISSERTITLTVSSGIQNIKKETVTFVQKAATPPELTGFSIVQSSIKKNEATFKLSFNSMYKLQEYGVFYSKNSNMNNAVKATVVEDVSGVNEVGYTLTGLESMTTYYVYGYIHNTVGDSDTKSNIVLEFTTAGVKPGGDDNPTPNLSRRKK